MSRKSTGERWLIYQAMQEGNRQSAENSVLSNRAESVRKYNQSRFDFTGSRGLQGDYDANPLLGMFDTDTSLTAGEDELKKKKNMFATGAA